MRVRTETAAAFYGTHRGCTVQIDREPDGSMRGRYYIIIKTEGGGVLYDGWAPAHTVTMRDAKREALRGAGLAGEIETKKETQ